MTIIRREALTAYSASDLFQLVNDIESYPEFLPWCNFAEVHRQNTESLEATLGIKHGVFKKLFTTRNELYADKEIRMTLMKGPFKHMKGCWRFESLGIGGSRICLEMDFEFSTPLLAFTMGPVFSKISKTLVDAFCQRAKRVYG